jgi:hypothetical protein
MERYRFHDDGALFYVTFSVVEWLPVFISEPACKIIADSFNFLLPPQQGPAHQRLRGHADAPARDRLPREL